MWEGPGGMTVYASVRGPRENWMCVNVMWDERGVPTCLSVTGSVRVKGRGAGWGVKAHALAQPNIRAGGTTMALAVRVWEQINVR